MERIGIIAGSGEFPLLMAEEFIRRGLDPVVVAIEEEADKLNELINNLLDASRLQAVGLQLQFAYLDLPSMAEISRRFSDRKGASLAIFGIGGSFGDIFGPVITGILLGLLAWQSVISIYAIVPLLMTFWSIWAFTGASRAEQLDEVSADKNVDLGI